MACCEGPPLILAENRKAAEPKNGSALSALTIRLPVSYDDLIFRKLLKINANRVQSQRGSLCGKTPNSKVVENRNAADP
jgi:hypothetical protein